MSLSLQPPHKKKFKTVHNLITFSIVIKNKNGGGALSPSYIYIYIYIVFIYDKRSNQ